MPWDMQNSKSHQVEIKAVAKQLSTVFEAQLIAALGFRV